MQCHDLDLILLDLDGTLLDSAECHWQGLRRAVRALGGDTSITKAEIESCLGLTSDEYYRRACPEEFRPRWREIQTILRSLYPEIIPAHGRLYPGVRETLRELRVRGYRLALCTNASVRYRDVAVPALGLDALLDGTDCSAAHGVDKHGLVEILLERFGTRRAAIVGDRIHDIEAGRQSGIATIGVRYGYGRGEEEEADLLLDSFSQLLAALPARAPENPFPDLTPPPAKL